MSRVLLFLRWGLGLLIMAYALLIALLQVLWRTPALGIWWVQLLNVFGLWLYLPLPLCLLLSIVARPRAARLLLAVPLVCFGWEYGALFIPKQASAAGTPLRVMSWNILYRNQDIDAIARLIRQHHPDVVALQELGESQAAALQPLLEGEYPYQALDPGGTAGLGVWSRHPIMQRTPAEDRRTGCSCQRLVLEVQGRPIRLVNAHPVTPQFGWRPWLAPGGIVRIPLPRGFSTGQQEPALDALVAEAGTGGDPLIMVGDFNTSDRQPNYWRLRRYLKDAYREAGIGFGLTFPNGNWKVGPYDGPALLRIDYILHSAELAATRAYTAAMPSSDHRAIIADLSLT